MGNYLLLARILLLFLAVKEMSDEPCNRTIHPETTYRCAGGSCEEA